MRAPLSRSHQHLPQGRGRHMQVVCAAGRRQRRDRRAYELSLADARRRLVPIHEQPRRQPLCHVTVHCLRHKKGSITIMPRTPDGGQAERSPAGHAYREGSKTAHLLEEGSVCSVPVACFGAGSICCGRLQQAAQVLRCAHALRLRARLVGLPFALSRLVQRLRGGAPLAPQYLRDRKWPLLVRLEQHQWLPCMPPWQRIAPHKRKEARHKCMLQSPRHWPPFGNYKVDNQPYLQVEVGHVQAGACGPRRCADGRLRLAGMLLQPR